MSKRVDRLNEQLKREISDLLRTRVRDPRVGGGVTVTGVATTSDLSVARVHVSLRGSEAERAQSLEGLTAAAPFLRTLLGRILHIRRVPELRFREDRTLERARRVERILHEVLPDELQPDGVRAEEDVPPGVEGSAPPASPLGDGR